MLAGGLGVGVDYLANLSGQKGEPFVLGVFVFLIGNCFLIKNINDFNYWIRVSLGFNQNLIGFFGCSYFSYIFKILPRNQSKI